MQDSEVISGILESTINPQLIAKFYEMYRIDFIRFAKSYFKVDDDFAAEIYQESYYIMYSNFIDGRVKELNCALKTYLFAIGRNLIMNELKKDKKHIEIIDIESIAAIPDLDVIEEENGHSRKMSIVRDAVSALKDPCKTILTMFYWGKKKLAEILPELPNYKKIDTLKNQKSKCLDRLEKLLKDEFSKNSIFI